MIIYIFYLIQKKELVSDVNRKEVKREAKLEGMRVAMKVRVLFKICYRVKMVTLLLMYTCCTNTLQYKLGLIPFSGMTSLINSIVMIVFKLDCDYCY